MKVTVIPSANRQYLFAVSENRLDVFHIDQELFKRFLAWPAFMAGKVHGNFETEIHEELLFVPVKGDTYSSVLYQTIDGWMVTPIYLERENRGSITAMGRVIEIDDKNYSICIYLYGPFLNTPQTKIEIRKVLDDLNLTKIPDSIWASRVDVSTVMPSPTTIGERLIASTKFNEEDQEAKFDEALEKLCGLAREKGFSRSEIAGISESVFIVKERLGVVKGTQHAWRYHHLFSSESIGEIN